MTIVKEMLKERVRRVQVHKHVQEKTSDISMIQFQEE